MNNRRFLLLLILIVSLVPLAAPAHAVENLQAACATVSADNLMPGPECLRVMESFPEPVVTPVQQDGYTLSNYAFWEVTAESPLLFDAPGGNAIGQMPPGFNFVHGIETTEGWVRNRNNQWMSMTDLEYQEPSYFRGVRLLNGLENPFGWVLGDLVTVASAGRATVGGYRRGQVPLRSGEHLRRSPAHRWLDLVHGRAEPVDRAAVTGNRQTC